MKKDIFIRIKGDYNQIASSFILVNRINFKRLKNNNLTVIIRKHIGWFGEHYKEVLKNTAVGGIYAFISKIMKNKTCKKVVFYMEDNTGNLCQIKDLKTYTKFLMGEKAYDKERNVGVGNGLFNGWG